MKNVRVIVAPVSGDVDREDLERIEGESFESMDEVIDVLGSGDFEHYTLSHFMDLCNGTDSQTIEQEFENIIVIENNWIGYITLNK
jgi:hypothetical protein